MKRIFFSMLAFIFLASFFVGFGMLGYITPACTMSYAAEIQQPAPVNQGFGLGQIIGFVAPIIVIFLTTLLKKGVSSKFAPLIVFALGGISTLIGVGPTPGATFIDNTVNVAYVSGGATLLYDLIKKLFLK